LIIKTLIYGSQRKRSDTDLSNVTQISSIESIRRLD
jgi:hypothetical protein